MVFAKVSRNIKCNGYQDLPEKKGDRVTRTPQGNFAFTKMLYARPVVKGVYTVKQNRKEFKTVLNAFG